MKILNWIRITKISNPFNTITQQWCTGPECRNGLGPKS